MHLPHAGVCLTMQFPVSASAQCHTILWGVHSPAAVAKKLSITRPMPELFLSSYRADLTRWCTVVMSVWSVSEWSASRWYSQWWSEAIVVYRSLEHFELNTWLMNRRAHIDINDAQRSYSLFPEHCYMMRKRGTHHCTRKLMNPYRGCFKLADVSIILSILTPTVFCA